MFELGSLRKSESYLTEREIKQDRLRFLRNKRECLIKSGGPKEMNSNTSYLDADNIHGGGQMEALTLLNELIKTQSEISEVEAEIEEIDGFIKRIADGVKGLDSSEKRVYYLKTYCGYNLREISEELELTYDYVRFLSSRMEKEK